MTIFELELVGGPWGKRLASRRAAFDDLPWHEPPRDASPEDLDAARVVWTQSAFSEVAAAASFAEIASCLFAAGAPLDLAAAAGSFVVDEVLHAELSARVAASFGGGVALDVDLTRLVRPPVAASPLLRAAELLVRHSCVGEALTVPILKLTRDRSRSTLVREVVSRIVHDESAHAELGPWFLDWAAPLLNDDDRAHLGHVASDAVRDLAPLFSAPCTPATGLGVLDCESYDAVFQKALEERVAKPLAVRGIVLS
jgi:hypothetical protein